MVKVLDRESINRMTRNSGRGGSTYVGGGGGGGYTLPLAADGTRGGVQIGFTTDATARKYAVQLDNEKAYVNVPWTDHHAWSDITDKPETATRWPSWSEVTSKPTSFTPSAHTHAWGDITSNVPATATRWPSWGEVTSKPTSKSAWGQQYLDSNSSFSSISGNMSSVGHMSFSNNETQFTPGGGYSDPAPGSTFAFKFGGTLAATRVYSSAGVTALSDARMKNVLGDIVLSVADIAEMPAVRFAWKDEKNPGTFIGTLAQPWKKLLPEAVQPVGDVLTFDYNGAAIVCLVNIARAVQGIIEKLNRYGFK